MRLNRKWPEADLRLVVKQLTQEYPMVPAEVAALVVQLARLEVSPAEEPTALLAQARMLLGRSVLLHVIEDDSMSRGLAMAS